MPNQSTELSGVFHALADPTRRAVIERLGQGSAPMSELARPFKMALPSFAQHLDVLERSGLVRSEKSGRIRTYELTPKPLAIAEAWMSERRALWEGRPDRLDRHLLELHAEEKKKQKWNTSMPLRQSRRRRP